MAACFQYHHYAGAFSVWPSNSIIVLGEALFAKHTLTQPQLTVTCAVAGTTTDHAMACNALLLCKAQACSSSLSRGVSASLGGSANGSAADLSSAAAMAGQASIDGAYGNNTPVQVCDVSDNCGAYTLGSKLVRYTSPVNHK